MQDFSEIEKMASNTLANLDEYLLNKALEEAVEAQRVIDADAAAKMAENNRGVSYKPTTIASLVAAGCEYQRV
jgi:predicted transcriptional regulator